MNTFNFEAEKRNQYLIFGLVVLSTILLRLVFSTGFYLTADDYYYSKAAHEISEGHFSVPDNHWNARIGNTISIAAFYTVFGVGEYTATFSSICYTILIVFVIYFMSKELFPREDYKYIALLASIFYVFLPISIAEGSSLSMHQGVTFFMFLSFYLMLVGERTRNLAWYMLSGLVVGVSYLFHETGAYVFILMILYYFLKKRFEWQPLIILGMFVFVVGIEVLSYYYLTGEMFYRQNISLNPFETLQSNRVNTDMGFFDKFSTLKTINNPFNGTFLGDSWLFEPFRWSFLDPSNSILYYFIVVFSVILLVRGDKKIKLLLVMFSGLYLYYAYGSPNPFSYEPLRRLPRYTLPCAVIGSIIAGYGLYRFEKRSIVIASIMALYISVSIISISVKGGEIGQKIFQAKNFYQYISEHPDKRYLTDSNTFNGIEFVSQYHTDYEITNMRTSELVSYINDVDLQSTEEVLLINVPENYNGKLAELDHERLHLVQKFDRKPRKICYIKFVREKFADSLCNISKGGGRIYQVLPKV